MLTFMTIITQILQMLCVTQPAISISDVMYVTVSGGRSTTLANATLSLSHFLNQFFPLRAFQENVVLIWDVPRSQFFSFHNFANNAVFVFMQKFSNSVKNLNLFCVESIKIILKYARIPKNDIGIPFHSE